MNRLLGILLCILFSGLPFSSESLAAPVPQDVFDDVFGEEPDESASEDSFEEDPFGASPREGAGKTEKKAATTAPSSPVRSSDPDPPASRRPSSPPSSDSSPTDSSDPSRFGYTIETLPDSFRPIPIEEARELLDKAEQALLVDTELSPLDLVRCAFVLSQNGNKELTVPLAKKLLQRFNGLELKERELFDVTDYVGSGPLTEMLAISGLAPESTTAVEQLLAGYNGHLLRKEPLEKVLLWRDPRTPWEMINAANSISKSGRVEVAGVLLKRFLGLETTPEQLAEIREKLGAEDLLRLSILEGVQPQGRFVVEKITNEVGEFLKQSHPMPFVEAIEKLPFGEKGQESALPLEEQQAETVRGITAIWRGNETSVEQMIAILGVSDDAGELAEIESLLRSMRSEAKEALGLVLGSGNSKLVGRAAKLLFSYVPEGEAFIFYPALFDRRLDGATTAALGRYVAKLDGKQPTASEAAIRLYTVALEYFDRDRKLRTDSDGQVAFWEIREPAGQLRYTSLPAVAAYRLMVDRFASQAYRLDPNNRAIQTFYHLARWEKIVNERGIDEPFDLAELGRSETAKTLGIQELEAILSEAMQRDCSAAGMVAATLLGQAGTFDSLLLTQPTDRESGRGLPRMLVQASGSGDRRIRFAALKAIMQLNPNRPYPGSSLVSDALLWFGRSEGRRLAVVGCPKIANAMMLSGFLSSLGYESRIATSCGDLFQEAIDSPDVEWAILDERCSKPIVSVFSQNMRNDIRTHELPVAIISADPEVLKATPVEIPLPLISKLELEISNTTLRHSLAMIFPYPQNVDSTAWIEGRLRKMTGANTVPPPIRLEQARQSLRWLAAMQRESSSVYRIENLEPFAFRAASSPILAEEGLEILAQIRSNQTQQFLAEYAINEAAPESLREKAALAFAENVKKHDVLIRGRQVKRLLDMFDFQVRNDKKSDTALESLVNTILERRRPASKN